MEEIINGLVEKVGLDKATAEKVIAFLKENADKLPALMKDGVGNIGDLKGKLPGGLGGMFGGD